MKRDTTTHVGGLMTCDQVSQKEFAEKYLLGNLSQIDQEAYELHYFACARCFQELKTLQALQGELKKSATAIRAEEARKSHVWMWAGTFAAATLVVALGFAVRLSWYKHTPGVEPQLAVQKSPRSPGNAPAISLLAEVEPLPYVPVTLRGDADVATREYQRAMKQYLKGNYTAAIPGLRAALKADPNASDAWLYLGICELLTGQTDRAIETLHKTIGLGDSPYLDGAHFYLAKAYLRMNNMAAAEQELKETMKLHKAHETEAQRLLEQVESLSSTRQ